jgi:ribonuclease HI
MGNGQTHTDDSNIVTQEETFTRGNSKKMVLKDLMAEEGSKIKVMWVPAHVGVKGNETANKAAKETSWDLVPDFLIFQAILMDFSCVV